MPKEIFEAVLLEKFRLSDGLDPCARLRAAASTLFGPSGDAGGVGASEAAAMVLTAAMSSSGISLGRDRASATKLAFPCT